MSAALAVIGMVKRPDTTTRTLQQIIYHRAVRWLVIAMVVLGCGGHGSTAPGSDAQGSGARVCLPSGGCAAGPKCGLACCRSGEHCENNVCRCGNQSACGVGDGCEAAGPIGQDGCGSICCGASGPCPQ
jgi:hypothetical protein